VLFRIAKALPKEWLQLILRFVKARILFSRGSLADDHSRFCTIIEVIFALVLIYGGIKKWREDKGNSGEYQLK
jgi:uncharacterized membrane protein YphA (DoxX/SURF4 family)